MDLKEEQSESSEESDTSRDQTNGISIEFRNEASLSDGSDSDSDSETLSDFSDSELNPFHSTFNAKDEDLDSFVTFEASSLSVRGGKNVKRKGEVGGEEGGERDGVFMNEFSESSGEGRNILGDLESQVMNASLSRFRP